MSKLEEEAEKREEAREMRRLEFVAKIEEKRREIEMKHEERLMRMFMTVLSQCRQHTYPPENPYVSSPTSPELWFHSDN